MTLERGSPVGNPLFSATARPPHPTALGRGEAEQAVHGVGLAALTETGRPGAHLDMGEISLIADHNPYAAATAENAARMGMGDSAAMMGMVDSAAAGGRSIVAHPFAAPAPSAGDHGASRTGILNPHLRSSSPLGVDAHGSVPALHSRSVGNYGSRSAARALVSPVDSTMRGRTVHGASATGGGSFGGGLAVAEGAAAAGISTALQANASSNAAPAHAKSPPAHAASQTAAPARAPSIIDRVVSAVSSVWNFFKTGAVSIYNFFFSRVSS